MPNASFGPVFVVPPLPIAFTTYVFNKTTVSIYKKKKKERRTYLWPKRRRMRHLGPFWSPPPKLTLPIPLKHQ